MAAATWFAAAAPPARAVDAHSTTLDASHRRQARGLLAALDLRDDGQLDNADLLQAAEKLDVAVGGVVGPHDVDRLLAAQRAGAGPVLRRLGLDFGTRVDEEDVRHAAARIHLDVGRHVDPADVRRLVEVGTTPSVVARYATTLTARAAAIAAMPFATVGAVALLPPSHHVRLVGFHQAASGRADELAPTARPGMRTLPSRGRGTGRHTAADVAVAPGTTVVAPVTGRVVTVEHYALYGRYDDLRLTIVPSSDPGRVVTVLHVVGARVAVGDEVVAGETPIAAEAHQLPFTSQIDEWAGHGPHVHVELRAR